MRVINILASVNLLYLGLLILWVMILNETLQKADRQFEKAETLKGVGLVILFFLGLGVLGVLIVASFPALK